MNIWFGTTTHEWKTNRELYFSIRKHLLDLGCVLLFDWIPDADKFMDTGYKKRNITNIFTQVLEAIDNASAVIIEYSIPNFSTSHQINYALLKKKPLLVMRTINDNPRFSDSYLEAIQSPYLTIVNYKQAEYKQVIEEFIGSAQIETGQKRYNIVLGKKHKHYLDWASSKYGISRSEIIKQFIDTQIKINPDYNSYLRNALK